MAPVATYSCGGLPFDFDLVCRAAFTMSQSAREILQAASNKEQTAKTRGITSFFGGGSSAKLEEARDLYNKAANILKGEKNFKESGDAFCRAAECALKSDEKYDAAMDYWSVQLFHSCSPSSSAIPILRNAGKAYKQSHPDCETVALSRHCYSLTHRLPVAVGALDHTVELYKDQGRYRQAADRKSEVPNQRNTPSQSKGIQRTLPRFCNRAVTTLKPRWRRMSRQPSGMPLKMLRRASLTYRHIVQLTSFFRIARLQPVIAKLQTLLPRLDCTKRLSPNMRRSVAP